MLRALRRHPVVRGCLEVLADAALYLAALLAALVLLGQLARLAL